MTNVIEPLILGGSAIAGFEVARRWVPQTGFLGTYNDLVFGVGVFAAGYFLHSKAMTAFGIGAAVEGVLVIVGF